MQIEIQRNAEVSLSKQIYQSVVDRIRSGLLQEGVQLPSVRDLSKQLGVSLVTAVKAYQQLEQEGFINSIQGKQSRVIGGKETAIVLLARVSLLSCRA